MNKIVKIILIIFGVMLLLLFLLKGVRPLNKVGMPDTPVMDFICSSQSVPGIDSSINCKILKQTGCSNLACLSQQDYERCIAIPSKRNNAKVALGLPSDGQPDGCLMNPLKCNNWYIDGNSQNTLRAAYNESCLTSYYDPNLSMEDIGFYNEINPSKQCDLQYICENPKHTYTCICEHL